MYRSPDQLLRVLKMVKLKGPGLAAGASGQLGGELIFSNWKGRAYMKKSAAPKQPRADGQVAMRAMMKWLSAHWVDITPALRATWAKLAATTNVAPINAYQGYNLERWRSNKYPSIVHPATEYGGATYLEDITAEGFIRHAVVGYRITNPNDGWGLFLHRAFDHPITPAWHNLVAVVDAQSNGTFTYEDPDLVAGEYCYQFTRSTKYGVDGIVVTPCVHATVTD